MTLWTRLRTGVSNFRKESAKESSEKKELDAARRLLQDNKPAYNPASFIRSSGILIKILGTDIDRLEKVIHEEGGGRMPIKFFSVATNSRYHFMAPGKARQLLEKFRTAHAGLVNSREFILEHPDANIVPELPKLSAA